MGRRCAPIKVQVNICPTLLKHYVDAMGGQPRLINQTPLNTRTNARTIARTANTNTPRNNEYAPVLTHNPYDPHWLIFHAILLSLERAPAIPLSKKANDHRSLTIALLWRYFQAADRRKCLLLRRNTNHQQTEHACDPPPTQKATFFTTQSHNLRTPLQSHVRQQAGKCFKKIINVARGTFSASGYVVTILLVHVLQLINSAQLQQLDPHYGTKNLLLSLA